MEKMTSVDLKKIAEEAAAVVNAERAKKFYLFFSCKYARLANLKTNVRKARLQLEKDEKEYKRAKEEIESIKKGAWERVEFDEMISEEIKVWTENKFKIEKGLMKELEEEE